MSGVTLVEFILARLDEDEQVAQASSGRRWGHDGYRGWHSPFGQSHCTVHHEGNPFSHQQTNHVCGSALPTDAEHIARHDPARVLAEVAAKRAIIEMHRCIDNSSDAPCCRLCEYGAAGDDENPYITSGSGRVWPCRTLRLLALPYDSHVDYLSEWKPDSADGPC